MEPKIVVVARKLKQRVHPSRRSSDYKSLGITIAIRADAAEVQNRAGRPGQSLFALRIDHRADLLVEIRHLLEMLWDFGAEIVDEALPTHLHNCTRHRACVGAEV